jgi:hypothetical protein
MDLKEKRIRVKKWVDLGRGCPFLSCYDKENRWRCKVCHSIVGLQPFGSGSVFFFRPCPCILLGSDKVMARAERFLEETGGL